MSEVMPIFKLLRVIRDAQSTRNADRSLLNALAMRCQPAKQFVCWPSYQQLAEDTLLDEVTLRRAAKRLEAAGLIKRAVRMNRSNLFYINVAELLKQAQGVFAAKAAKKKEAEISPFEEVEFEMAAEDSEDEGFGGGAGWEE